MEANILHIKNMVCPRCLWAVEGIMDKLGIGYEKVSLGEVVTTVPKDKIKKLQELKIALQEYSSPSHFSNQFKLHTGYSPQQFKRMKQGSGDSKIM